MRVLFNNTLAIDRAQPEDGGNYVCRGSNGYSEAQDSVDIVVEDLQVIRVILGEILNCNAFVIGLRHLT